MSQQLQEIKLEIVEEDPRSKVEVTSDREAKITEVVKNLTGQALQNVRVVTVKIEGITFEVVRSDKLGIVKPDQIVVLSCDIIMPNICLFRFNPDIAAFSLIGKPFQLALEIFADTVSE